jgi:hypothetical protein
VGEHNDLPYCIPLMLEWGRRSIVCISYSKIVSPNIYAEARCFSQKKISSCLSGLVSRIIVSLELYLIAKIKNNPSYYILKIL